MKLEFWSFQDSRQLNIHFLTLNTDSHFILYQGAINLKEMIQKVYTRNM